MTTESQQPEDPPRPEIKLERKPPMLVRVLNGIGILVGGLGIFFVALAMLHLVALARENAEDQQCRSDLAVAEQGILGEVNILGWEGLSAEVTGTATPQETLDRAQRAQLLAQDWHQAHADRKNYEEICG